MRAETHVCGGRKADVDISGMVLGIALSGLEGYPKSYPSCSE